MNKETKWLRTELANLMRYSIGKKLRMREGYRFSRH